MGAFFTAGQEHGWLRPVVGQEFPLDQAEQSHVEVIEHKNGTQGKIVLNVWRKLPCIGFVAYLPLNKLQSKDLKKSWHKNDTLLDPKWL